MVRILFDNAKTALAFAAVIVVGAGFVAANFEGVKDRSSDATGDGTETIETLPEPAPEPSAAGGEADYSDLPDGWYDTPYDDVEGSQPIDNAQGLDPTPDLSTDPMAEEYIILESDASDAGEYGPEEYQTDY